MGFVSNFLKATLKQDTGIAGARIARDEPNSLYEALKAMARGAGFWLRGVPVLADPTTASTQATGAGATAWRVNLGAFVVSVDGVKKEFAAAADTVIHSATQLVANGKSCIAAIVAKKDSAGVITVVAVKGTAATTGSQVAPTDKEIQTAIGFIDAAQTKPLAWFKLGEATINRTGDTTVTQTEANDKTDDGVGVTIE